MYLGQTAKSIPCIPFGLIDKVQHTWFVHVTRSFSGLLVECIEFQLHFIDRILLQELHLVHCVVKVLLAGSHGRAAHVQPKGWDLRGTGGIHLAWMLGCEAH